MNKQMRIDDILATGDTAFELLPPAEQLALLRDNSVNVEENARYDVPLAETEISERKDQYLDADKRLREIADEKKSANRQFKDRMGVVEEEKDLLWTEITTKARSERGDLYSIPDYDKGQMMRFNSEGVMVDTRPLKPKERQGYITMSQRKVV